MARSMTRRQVLKAAGASLTGVAAVGATGGVAYAGSAHPWTAASLATSGAAPQAGSPWYDVRAFGAQGDGTTDDTAAIQSAITAANPTGGTVFLSPGTYRVTASLTFSSPDVVLMGAGTASRL